VRMNFCAYEFFAYRGLWLHVNSLFENSYTLGLGSVAAT